jgi:hypothetical protein
MWQLGSDDELEDTFSDLSLVKTQTRCIDDAALQVDEQRRLCGCMRSDENVESRGVGSSASQSEGGQ